MKKINRILFLFSLFFISLYSLGFSKSTYYDRGLTYPRAGNTTTLLPNGNILVTGGYNDSGQIVSQAEIYIPSKGYFDLIPTGNGTVPVSSHTATLLPNGYVLIYGGNNSSKTSSNYWRIYNPETNSFSSYYIDANYARAGHTATLLTQGINKGKVLICGGSKYTSGVPANVNRGCFLLKFNANYTAVTDKEDFGSTGAGTSGVLRAGHTATLLSNGNVFITGGLPGPLNYETNVATAAYMPGNETYDAWENRMIHNDDPLKIARTDHAAITLNDGRVMIIGGYNYLYLPNTSVWTPFDPNSTEDWYNYPNDGYGVRARHAPGPHGFLGDVEFFDQNGGRASVITSEGSGLPYRVSRAAGVLSPDGHINLHGGRGNIQVTLGASIEVVFNADSILKPTGYSVSPENPYAYVSNINNVTSHATAPLPKTALSTKVSGRFLNADAFVPPADQDTYVAIKEGTDTDGGLRVSFVHPSPGNNGYATKSDIRLWLDNLPVGRYINPKMESGQIKYNSVPVYDLDGTYTVYPLDSDSMVPTLVTQDVSYIEMYSEGSGGAVYNMGSGTLSTSQYDNCPGRADSEGAEPITCHGYLPNFTLKGIEVTVPSYFDGATLTGDIHIDMGSIKFEISGKKVRNGRFSGNYMEEEWQAKMIKSSYLGTSHSTSYGDTPYWPQLSTTTYSKTPTCTRDADGAKTCTLKLPDLNLGKFTFEFVNNSTHAIYYTDLDSAIGTIDLQSVRGIITFKPSLINLEGITYESGASTIVVRDMLFSNTLTYDPATSVWDTNVGVGSFYEFNAEGVDAFVDGVPPRQTALMDHSMLIDPAGAPIIIGGRSCSPSDCKRHITTQNDFYDLTGKGVHVYHNINSEGHVILQNNLNEILQAKRFLPSTENIAKMKTPRQGHSTSSLPNGNILVCGGSDGNKTLNTCELYDLQKKEWSFTGSMSTPRSGHTATLLPNGKVLVAGGTDGYNFINTSEIYNPKTGTFDDVLKSMKTARRNHTATLLPNGNVFVVGGSSETYNEIFITTRAVWEKRYNGPTGRLVSHEAVLLRDGKVAVIGGLSGSQPNGKYYLFDPISLSTAPIQNDLHWKNPGVSGCGGEPFGIYKHKAIMDMNGNVWLIGGTTGNSYSSFVIVYSYDPATGKLGDTTNCPSGSGLLVGNLTDGVVGHSAMIAPDNIITVFGGNTQHRTLGQHHIINADQRSIMVTVKKDASGGDKDDDDDGKTGNNNKNNYEKYDVLKELRTNHTMILDAEGNYYIIGGDNGKGKIYDTVERIYFTVPADTVKISSEDSPRKPKITNQADENVQPGSNLTLLSTDTFNHFHGYTDAGDGTAVHHNAPRVLLQAVDMPSGFLIDVSTLAYAHKDWNLMMSSITVKLPGFTGTNGNGNVNTELPWGYYYALESVNGQFTNFKRIQVGENWEIPDITGDILPSTDLSTYGQHPIGVEASEYAIYYSSVVWTWPHIDYVNYPYINGYEVYSATFTEASLGRVELNTAHDPVIVSTALQPNYPAKIKVVPYNIWTEGENFRESSIYYTLAETPVLSIDAASGNYATLNWTSNNFDGTCYEVDWCHTNNQTENCFDPDATYRTSSGTFRSTSFDNLSCYSTTTFNTTELDGITGYSFRVRAINGTIPALWGDHHNNSGYKTEYSNIVSTINVKDIDPETIIGSPSTGTITWSWPAVEGYVVDYVVRGYDPDTGDMFPIADTGTLTTSDARVSFTQTYGRDGPVIPNMPFSIAVQPKMRDMQNHEYIGNISTSVVVYTLANAPTYVDISPATVVKSSTTNEKIQTIIVKWGDAGNSGSTEYKVELSTQPDFEAIAYSTQTVYSADGIISGELEVNTYYYARVTSINDAGKPSDEITYATAPVCTFTNPPGDVQISSNNVAGIGIKWDYNGNPEIYDSDGVNQIGTIYNVMISTDAAFPEGATFTDITFDNEYLFTGLLTSLKYYISVNSENQAGHTVDMEGTVSTKTVVGPEGTWPGSIIGMTDPVNDKDIYGNLLTGRYVSLYVPAAAYTVPTELAISSVTFNSCGSYGSDLGGHIIAAQVFTNNPDPMVPVDFTIGYFDTEANVIEQNQDSIVLARYNSVTNSCLPLTTTINTNTKRISASVNTFDWNTSLLKGTILQVIKYVTPSTLADVQIYPNPFYPNRGDGYVQIEPVPANTKLTLYTLSGAKVWEGTSGRSSVITWDGKNKSGVRVASGIYLGVLEAPSGKKKIKIAVEK